MKFRAKRQAIRRITSEQEGQMVLRQRDRLFAWLSEREDWCSLVSVKDVRGFFPMDPTGEGDAGDPD